MSRTFASQTGFTAAARALAPGAAPAAGLRPVLALDASTDYCSVGIACGSEVLFSGSVHAPRRHSEVLHPLLAEAFERLGWEAPVRGPQLLGIGVTVGPGSFTGLRIGIAAATGLATAWGLRVAPLSSLAVMAAAAASAAPATGTAATSAAAAPGRTAAPDRPEPRIAFAPALATRSGDCYAALFSPIPGTDLVSQIGPVRADRPQAALEGILETAATAGRFQRIWLCGLPWEQLRLGDDASLARMEGGQLDYPQPGVLAVMAEEALAGGEGVPPSSVTPIYIRRSDAG